MVPTGISYTKCAFRGNFSEARRQLICARLRVHVGTQEFTRTTFANARTERGRKLRGGELILEVSLRPIFSSWEHNRLTAPLECSSALMILSFRILRKEDCGGMRLKIYHSTSKHISVASSF